MEFECSEHGERAESVSLRVLSTETDGTERDWEGVHFTVNQPEESESLSAKHISFSNESYVEDVFTREKVAEDMLKYFRRLFESKNQSKLAERGWCSEKRSGRGSPTCFPEVVV